MRAVVTTDPVDARLLGVIAELGRAAVHEVAARVGMDPREVAARLVMLSAAGLPLLVGVECDPHGLRTALARMNQPAYGVPFSPYPAPGGYPAPPSGPLPAFPQNPPSGAQPVVEGPHGPYPPSGPLPAQSGPPSYPVPTPSNPSSIWGPPQTSSWARGDRPPAEGVTPMDSTQPTVRAERANSPRVGPVGATLHTEGLAGERLAIQLIEVVDPADYLFTAAGYRLQPGERSVVVHTEVTNRGSTPLQSLPDLCLVLVTSDGQTISKAPVSLSSRPPHRVGIAPGDTAGGHTVYVVAEPVEISSVRWSPRPDELSHALTWNIEH